MVEDDEKMIYNKVVIGYQIIKEVGHNEISN